MSPPVRPRTRAAVLCAALSALTIAGMAGTAIAYAHPAPATPSRACVPPPSQVAPTGTPQLDSGAAAACVRAGAPTPDGGVATATNPTP